MPRVNLLPSFFFNPSLIFAPFANGVLSSPVLQSLIQLLFICLKQGFELGVEAICRVARFRNRMACDENRVNQGDGLHCAEFSHRLDPIVTALAIQLTAASLKYANVARYVCGGRTVRKLRSLRSGRKPA